MIFAAGVVTEQRRGLIQINNQDIEIAVVIEVAEGTAAAYMRCCDGRTGFAQ